MSIAAMGESDGREFKALRAGKAEQGEAGFIRQRLVLCDLLCLQKAKDEKADFLNEIGLFAIATAFALKVSPNKSAKNQ